MSQPEVDNYAFIMNVRRLVDFDSHEVIHGHTVRRASEVEIAEIRNTVTALAGARGHISQIWETRWDDAHTHTQGLPQNLWRYFVVAFRGNNSGMNELHRACYLSSAELDIGPTIVHHLLEDQLGHGPIHNPGAFFQSTELLQHTGETAYIDLSRDDLEEIGSIWLALTFYDNALIDIKTCINQLHQLNALPAYSPMKFLGYFAVLESLLTHVPKPMDPYDSITRQVKKKMTLLDNRFKRRLNYAPFGAPPETVWGKMYTYRSKIAHTGQAKIEKDVELLQSPAIAFALLRSATRAVARQALLEPRLVADLRDC